LSSPRTIFLAMTCTYTSLLVVPRSP
jgi:hypothetical protein